MKEYEFELRLALASDDADLDDVVERLGEEGCTDALVGIGRRGHIALTFLREAESAWQAVIGAIYDVGQAIPEARLHEAAPDLVGLTDIGCLLSVTRQNVRKLAFSTQSPPPTPVHEGRPTIWHLSTMLDWLREERGYPVDERLVELSWTTMQVNLALGCQKADPVAQQKILSLLR